MLQHPPRSASHLDSTHTSISSKFFGGDLGCREMPSTEATEILWGGFRATPEQPQGPYLPPTSQAVIARTVTVQRFARRATPGSKLHRPIGNAVASVRSCVRGQRSP